MFLIQMTQKWPKLDQKLLIVGVFDRINRRASTPAHFFFKKQRVLGGCYPYAPSPPQEGVEVAAARLWAHGSMPVCERHLHSNFQVDRTNDGRLTRKELRHSRFSTPNFAPLCGRNLSTKKFGSGVPSKADPSPTRRQRP